MNILGVRIDNLSKKQLLEKVARFLSEDSFHQITTVNPEFVLRAHTNPDFKRILNEGALNIADGIGLKYAFWRHGRHLKQRISGVDLMHEILKIANKNKLEVFLAASTQGLSSWEQTAAQLRKTYPSVIFSGKNVSPEGFSTYRVPAAAVLFCSFGSPAQEVFIYRQKHANLKLAMGVGGAFDFVCGKLPRAPRWLRDFGLEWLWRFLLEPRYRAKRIFRAIIIFPIKIIINK